MVEFTSSPDMVIHKILIPIALIFAATSHFAILDGTREGGGGLGATPFVFPNHESKSSARKTRSTLDKHTRMVVFFYTKPIFDPIMRCQRSNSCEIGNFSTLQVRI